MAMDPGRFAPLALVAAGLLIGSVSAQQPAPGPATDVTIWSPLEASALTHVRRLLDGAKGSVARPIRLPRGGLSIPGFRILCYARGENDEIVEVRSATLQNDVFLLAWPTARTAETRRGIALHGDGTTMFCELSEDDPADASADVLTGRGSEGKFADVLRQPGTSSSGHFWLWLQQVSKHAKVVVVDGQGAPRPDCEVAFVGPGIFLGQRTDIELPEGPWPVGNGVTDAEGRARLSGPRCNDLRVVLQPTRGSVIATGFTLESTEGGLRVVLTRKALRAASVRGNESAAIATLKNITSAQAQCQASGAIDVDADGNGEYGFFAELAGAVPVRGETERKITPPVLSSAFARVTASCAQRSGYLYRIYLPTAEGKAASEAETGGGADRGVDPNLAERVWCLYAWPAIADSGQRAFFVNQMGDILACANADDDGNPLRVGVDGAPSPQSAFTEGSAGITGDAAANQKGQNGERWTVVN